MCALKYHLLNILMKIKFYQLNILMKIKFYQLIILMKIKFYQLNIHIFVDTRSKFQTLSLLSITILLFLLFSTLELMCSF